MKKLTRPMQDFTFRFTELIRLLKEIGCPKPQLEFIKHDPVFNPLLAPKPQDWWKASFDWFIAIELIPGNRYGPFYVMHGEWFWPQIGEPEILYSEKKCFLGLEKVKTKDEAKKKYNLHSSNPMNYLYKIDFSIDEHLLCCTPWIFVGPVKDGTGFQMNPNRITCVAIRKAIAKGDVWRAKVKNKIISDKFEQYNP